MVKKNYQVRVQREKTARAMMKNKPVSLKYSTEIASSIRGKRVDRALAWLGRVMRKEEYLPLRKYNKKIGHRKGQAMGFTKTGRYPVRAVGAFIELLESVKANADYKGMDQDNLIITHAFASQGFRRASNQPQGRIAGKARKKKSAHLEIIAREAG